MTSDNQLRVQGQEDTTKQKPAKPTLTIIQFVILIGFFIILCVTGAGAYFFGKNTQQTPQQITKPATSPTLYFLGSHPQSPTLAPTPYISKGPLEKVMITSWQRYKDHYSEVSLDYPVGWTGSECPGEGSGLGCINFYPKTDDQNIFADLITFGVYGNYIPVPDDVPLTLIQDNLPIPALTQNEKAALYQASDGTLLITFTHNTVKYYFTISNNYVHIHNFDIASIEDIMKHMAGSITFLSELYSCKDPALTSLTAFPENFTLLNGHESDTLDPLNAVEPYSRPVSDNSYLQNYTDTGTFRIFMVNYTKSGTEFENPAFSNTIAAVTGGTPTSSDQTGTEITHVNCVDTQEDGPGDPQIYSPSSDDSDPFAIHLYGYKNNPTNLWNVLKWNVNLLKKTRNEVYIRRGIQWQKYTANGYFVSLVQGYGGKPAIYLYPQKTSRISVAIHPQGKLIKTDNLYYPSVSGWSVNAQPNGMIENSYPYLYYEALLPFARPANGYVIPFKNLFSFVQNYVQKLGLNQTESNAFVSYWQSILQPSPYYFVSHLDQTTINNIYPLTISPKPDALLRVEIYFEPLVKPISVPSPFFLSPIKREGFTAVEWGAIYNK